MTSWTGEALYEKLRHVKTDNNVCTYTAERCHTLAPLVNEIIHLKREKDATILAHSYVHPDVLYTVADFVGDSLELSRHALRCSSKMIVFPAVRFMAETAKILNPEKLIIDPNPNGGCSLADSVTGEQVEELRRRYPEHTFVCYINTTAAVKAACDICVTSSNVYKIVAQLPTNKIYFLPDKLMGHNVIEYLKKEGIEKEVLVYEGSCYVHEEFQAEDVAFIRKRYPDVKVLAHPECQPAVVAQADLVGSTSKMHQYVKEEASQARHPFMLLTECGLTSRLQVEHPKLHFVGSCMLCRYMKANSLQEIAQALKAPQPHQIIEIPSLIRQKAFATVQRMLEFA